MRVNARIRNLLVAPCTGPTLIATGMAFVIANYWWPAMPLAIAIALIALGATVAVVYRTQKAGTFPISVAANLAAYVSLYLLLLCAICDAAERGPLGELTFIQGIDLCVSAAVMAVAVWLAVRRIRGGEDVPAR